MKTNKFNKEEYIDFIKFIIDKAFEGSGYSPVNDTTSQKTEIEQIKENILKEKKIMESKDKKYNFNYELTIRDINYKIDFLQELIENINLNKLNVWELDVLRGQLKELIALKSILKNNFDNE